MTHTRGDYGSLACFGRLPKPRCAWQASLDMVVPVTPDKTAIVGLNAVVSKAGFTMAKLRWVQPCFFLPFALVARACAARHPSHVLSHVLSKLLRIFNFFY